MCDRQNVSETPDCEMGETNPTKGRKKPLPGHPRKGGILRQFHQTVSQGTLKHLQGFRRSKVALPPHEVRAVWQGHPINGNQTSLGLILPEVQQPLQGVFVPLHLPHSITFTLIPQLKQLFPL
jgi:hypothetical protein